MFVERHWRFIFIFGGFFSLLEAELLRFGWWQTQRAPYLSCLRDSQDAQRPKSPRSTCSLSRSHSQSILLGFILVHQHDIADENAKESARAESAVQTRCNTLTSRPKLKSICFVHSCIASPHEAEKGSWTGFFVFLVLLALLLTDVF